MQVFFQSRDPRGAELRAGVERRVRFVLRRLAGRVPSADVQFSDVNGPRGGVDKHCQVALRPEGGAPVVVSSTANDWRRALDAALGRAARALVRLCKRVDATRRPARAPVRRRA